MINRSLYLGLAASAFVLVLGLPTQGSAGPGPVAMTTADAGLVQNVGHYVKRYGRTYYVDDEGVEHVRAPFTSVDTGKGTAVDAPFTSVRTGRKGTWVRAPFVNLFVPR